MVKFTAKQPRQLALLYLSLALTVTIVASQETLNWATISSATSPLNLVAGTYSRQVTVKGSAAFPSGLSLTSNDTSFVAKNGLALPAGSTTASDKLGCAAGVSAGVHEVSFSSNNANWTGPGSVWVNVSSSPIVLTISPNVDVQGTLPAGTTFDLSAYPPFADITISATAGDSNFAISPATITLTPNSTSGTFSYTANPSAQTNSNTVITFAISGTNAASYSLNQTSQTVNLVPASNNTVLSTNASSLTIVSGTYSLPMKLSITGAYFAEAVWVTTSTVGFAFSPLLVSNTSTLAVLGNLGCSVDVSAGQHTVAFFSNSTSYPAPSNIVVTVTKTPIDIPVGGAINILYEEGAVSSSDTVVFDLSAYPPWEDITITPTFPDGTNLMATPVSMSFTAAVRTATFVFQTTVSAKGNFTSQVSYVVSGANSASYVVSAKQSVSAISTGIADPNAGTNTTTNSTNGGTGGTDNNSTSGNNNTNGGSNNPGGSASASAVLMVSGLVTVIAALVIV